MNEIKNEQMESEVAAYQVLSNACDKAKEAYINAKRLGDAAETAKQNRKYNAADKKAKAAYVLVREYMWAQAALAYQDRCEDAQAKKSAAAKVRTDLLQKRFGNATPAQQAYIAFVVSRMPIEKLRAARQRSASTFIDAYKAEAPKSGTLPPLGGRRGEYVDPYALFMEELGKELAGGCTLFEAVEQMWSYE